MEQRQEKILKYLIREYIKTAEPVSSKFLAEKYKLGISQATLRWDMVKLTVEGYLTQPHTSAGRVPTEKAYHYYIENFSETKLAPEAERNIEEVFSVREKRELARELGKEIASISKNISILLLEREIFWQGLSRLLSQPEFYEAEDILETIESFEDFYKNIEENEFSKEDIKIYIGSENPFVEDKNLSLVFGGLEGGMIGILGPIRMDYQTNIALIKKVKGLLEGRA